MNIFVKVYNRIYNKIYLNKYYKDRKVEIPTYNIIYCEIETPQFKSKRVYKMYRQIGKFDKSNMKFTHDPLLGGHDVYFDSIDSFKKSLIRVF